MINVNDVKERVDIRQGLEYYGLKFNSKGFAVCPFHADNKPSLYIYPNDGMFICFACGVKGDIIQFVQSYFKIPLPAALRKIDEDFSLGLSGKKQKGGIQRIRKEDEKLNKAINTADQKLKSDLKNSYRELCDELRQLYAALNKLHKQNGEAAAILKNKIKETEEQLDEIEMTM